MRILRAPDTTASGVFFRRVFFLPMAFLQKFQNILGLVVILISFGVTHISAAQNIRGQRRRSDTEKKRLKVAERDKNGTWEQD